MVKCQFLAQFPVKRLSPSSRVLSLLLGSISDWCSNERYENFYLPISYDLNNTTTVFSSRIALALNNSQRIICHWTKKPNQTNPMFHSFKVLVSLYLFGFFYFLLVISCPTTLLKIDSLHRRCTLLIQYLDTDQILIADKNALVNSYHFFWNRPI